MNRKQEIDILGSTLQVIPLGAGNEVGRSCIYLKYKDKSILFDCGILPGCVGEGALPLFDYVDAVTDESVVEDVDLVLVTHFHLDHAAALPNLTERRNFNGRVFCTHPTKAVIKMLLEDYVRLGSVENAPIYNRDEANACIQKIETVDYLQVVDLDGLRFWAYPAGHVLGACMFMVEISGVRVLYTGDFSLEEDRHLPKAAIPYVRPDVLICESTYGSLDHEKRIVREKKFKQYVTSVLRRGGKCLLPVFAHGRAQELLLLLEELWQRDEKLRKNFSIHFISRMAGKAQEVFQTYISYMNSRIQRQFEVQHINPFELRHISFPGGNFRPSDTPHPCVVISSPGMLQSGKSREFFEAWSEDSRNGVVLTGYSVHGTLADKLSAEPTEYESETGQRKARRCTVNHVSFSAHSDFGGTCSFIKAVQPQHVILVHGAPNKVEELRKGLEDLKVQAEEEFGSMTVQAGHNEEPLKFQMPDKESARLIDHPESCLDLKPVSNGVEDEEEKKDDETTPQIYRSEQCVRGAIVTSHFEHDLYPIDQLATKASLFCTEMKEILHIPFSQPTWVVIMFLNRMFADVQVCSQEGELIASEDIDESVLPEALLIEGTIRVVLHERRVTLHWLASSSADYLAECVAQTVLRSETCIQSARASSDPHDSCFDIINKFYPDQSTSIPKKEHQEDTIENQINNSNRIITEDEIPMEEEEEYLGTEESKEDDNDDNVMMSIGEIQEEDMDL
eukprot:TRINITY_DN1010_c1_g1_i1.p1 TRINITY_DN1010_c1_g1~~TRINITY_DN1010_c1_g1_i1.p1  ORF type:complete len:734 (+),score=249.19 TRINITY_DN1010_c1_g1_i1:139-2340(+)